MEAAFVASSDSDLGVAVEEVSMDPSKTSWGISYVLWLAVFGPHVMLCGGLFARLSF